MSLRLTLRNAMRHRIDLFGIVPDRIRELSTEQLEKASIRYDGHDLCLADVFQIHEGSRDTVIIEGDLCSADRVGGGMRDGRLEIVGSVGHQLALEMRGGSIYVRGNAGDYAASGLQGGHVEVTGNVAARCAAAADGSRRGMRGGSLLIHGKAGAGFAQRMRRGVIELHGDAEGDVANWMIAGTIVLRGKVAGLLGAGIRRGTLLWLHDSEPSLHAGFTAVEQAELSYLPLLTKTLCESSRAIVAAKCANGAALCRSIGDRASGGLAELLWYATESATEDVLSR